MRLQKMLLCLSHRRSLTLLDALGKDHDKLVHRWRENIERAMVVAQVHTTIVIDRILIQVIIHVTSCRILPEKKTPFHEWQESGRLYGDITDESSSGTYAFSASTVVVK